MSATINTEFPHNVRQILALPWLPKLVNAVLAVLMIWLLADNVMRLFRMNAEQPPQPSDTTHSPSPGTGKNVSSVQIASWHLFGEAGRVAGNKQTTVINAPETKLKLTLRGIIAEDDKHQGLAIIQNPKKEEQHFAIGNSIFGLATLEEIYVNRVIILRNGKYETLTLPEERLDLKIGVSSATEIQRGKLASDYRDAIVEGDFEKFVGVVDIENMFNDEGFYGFKLLAESEKGKHLLSELGLEHNDVVVEINGEVLADSIEAVNSLHKLKTAREVSFVVKRGNARLPYSFKTDTE